MHVSTLFASPLAFMLLLGSEDHTQHVAAAMRGLFLHYSGMPVLQQCLPCLPDPSNSPSFRQELISYTKKQDWSNFMDAVSSGGIVIVCNVFGA